MKVIGIIPARYGSSRFPGKPLALIGDKTMIRRTYERAVQSSLDGVVVATDDKRIFDEVRNFGGRVVMTSADHKSGTERCCEALGMIWGNYDAVVNIQGDEPFIDPRQIDAVADLICLPDVSLATLANPINDLDRLTNPNVVKVVIDNEGNALYFSRQAIPFVRSAEPLQWLDNAQYLQHIGIYAYRSDVLRRIATLAPGRLEQAESLEQLRWLEHGFKIRVAVTDLNPTYAIDTPDDLHNIPQDLLR